MAGDLKTFSKACEELYKPGLRLVTFPSRSFAFLQRLVPAELIAMGNLDVRQETLEIGFDHVPSNFNSAMEAFGRLMSKYPLYNWDPTTNGGRPFCRSHFYSLRRFRDTDIYQEVYVPLGIDNHCAVHVPTRPGEILFYGLERKGGPDFSSEELALLELAQSQLGNAFRMAELFDETADERVDPFLLAEAGLTPRESETLYWMNCGKSNAEIAGILKVGLYTVKAHVTSIFNKTGAGSRLAAVVWARQTCHRLRFPPEEATRTVKMHVDSARRDDEQTSPGSAG